jgi:hypothetical protein
LLQLPVPGVHLSSVHCWHLFVLRVCVAPASKLQHQQLMLLLRLLLHVTYSLLLLLLLPAATSQVAQQSPRLLMPIPNQLRGLAAH